MVDFIINGGCIGHGTPKISELLNSHKGLITNTDAGDDVWIVWSWLEQYLSLFNTDSQAKVDS